MRVLPAGQRTLPNAAHPTLDNRLFSAKEAAYKTHCPMAKHVFGFHALAVDLSKGCARLPITWMLPQFRPNRAWICSYVRLRVVG
ncbi:4'-phosphopantetheinyl transferase superfamily protein [Antarctobacter heliothermus]|uniref:4'-phosphopantetheinyl transferase superfamily protein n=1 Tax=Antarctobacter heliothermus TaxID=74033 RepID=UPI000B8BDEC6|nr:4'-phosphopantetheinyl transferase superfamily protein [Antarctobacter heliothermus]